MDEDYQSGKTIEGDYQSGNVIEGDQQDDMASNTKPSEPIRLELTGGCAIAALLVFAFFGFVVVLAIAKSK